MQKLIQVNDGNSEKKLALNSETDYIEMATELTEIILNKYESIMIEKTINKQYNYLDKNEQMFIKEECRQSLRNKRELLKKYIYEKTLLHLQTEESFNVEGFVTFRLQEYITEIENTLDVAVNELIVDREYEQLIDGLILYIELQVPLIDSVSIIYNNEKYIVTDNKGKEIFTLIHYDDVLLDVILTLAPRRIVVINPDQFSNQELLGIIQKVFGNRLCFIKTADQCLSHVESTSKVDKE